MKIGLIDEDSHNFPNLALMRISAYHKSIGDEVEWWWSDLNHYDIVYMSKVFSDSYSEPHIVPMNADKVIRGGQAMPFRSSMEEKHTAMLLTRSYRLKLSA